MKLKGRSAIELAKIFAMGKCPVAARLLGPLYGVSEWRVDLLTGPIPNLGGGYFKHRKQFHRRANGKVAGCNLFFRDLRWGWFVLDDRRDSDNVDLRRVLVFDYDQLENGLVTRDRMLDLVRTTDDPNVLLGEVRYALWGLVAGPYYFTLTRMDP
jgi:hypothetical protein